MYDSFLESWFVLDLEKQTLSKFFGKILDRTKKLSNYSEGDALMAQHSQGCNPSKNSTMRYPQHNQNQNYVAKHPQHYQGPWNSHQHLQSVAATLDQHQMTCNYSKKIGHWNVECFKLGRRNSVSQRPSINYRRSVTNNSHQPEEAGVINLMAVDINFIAIDLMPRDSDGYWVADSGCSHHITPKESRLVDYKLR